MTPDANSAQPTDSSFATTPAAEAGQPGIGSVPAPAAVTSSFSPPAFEVPSTPPEPVAPAVHAPETPQPTPAPPTYQPAPEPVAPVSTSLFSPPTPIVPGRVAAPAAPVEQLAPAPRQAAAATNPVMAMLAGAVLACTLFGTGIVVGRQTGGASDGLGGSGGSIGGVNPASGNAIVAAVQKVGPAVMNVDTTFGKGGDTNFLPLPGQEQPREGKGTGVVIDTKRGLMLTNAHVVAEAQKIQVTTRNGDKYTGKVIGFDRRSDIAVVELSNKTLPQAKLAEFKDPKELAIGQWTIAIGNPFAQANTVTVGVLSAIDRTLPVPPENGQKAFSLTGMLQTDTAINPGNSGGPLCNINGEVIGINTAIIPFGQGLGFTIPINKAMSVADQIIKTGKVNHPYIGVYVIAITDSLQADYGLPDKVGGLVQSLEPGSPAAKSGMEPGDVIKKLDGITMKSNEDVVNYVGKKKVNDVIKVEVLRNNSVKKTLSLKVGDRPE